MKRPGWNSILWGISIALSWTWGLGLFFSVQISLQFGLTGLLCFAIPNALGLMGFGLLTSRIAKRTPNPAEFERHFFQTSHTLRYVFLAYQLVAITLTFFAIFAYLFQPIGVSLALVVLVVLGAALFLGENFEIQKIKWSHLAMFCVILVSVAGVFLGLGHFFRAQDFQWNFADPHQSPASLKFLGFLVPMVTGLLVGPWLDLQQWHRAIQIHREKTSISNSYLAGGFIFFCILIFHGTLALLVRSSSGTELIQPTPDGLFHAKDYVVRFLFIARPEGVEWVLRYSYMAFLCLCIISTLDSGYVSLKWYLRELVKKSESVITTIIPPAALSSPIPAMLVAVLVAVFSVPLHFELEYFMSFYAAFSVAYAIVYLFRSVFEPKFTNFTQTSLFSVASLSLGMFGIGYFYELWFFMVIGSLFPIIYGVTAISARATIDDLQKALPREDETQPREESISGRAAEMAVTTLEHAIARLDPKTAEKFHSLIQKVEPQAAHMLATVLSAVQPATNGELALARPLEHDAELEHASGHFEGKWFCHTFMATYQDTNSVGNVYFGMYIMYVGKVREMFFKACMPEFDLRNSSFYILTRQIEHKFNLESREFDFITVKIRIESFNRKFATLEHQVFNQAKTLLGKGKQVLLFVSSKDYSIIDIPGQVQKAFLPHV